MTPCSRINSRIDSHLSSVVEFQHPHATSPNHRISHALDRSSTLPLTNSTEVGMDSKMDVDIGKLPEPHRLSPATEPASIPTLDGWIENLMNCKQLAENDVQRLCDRVCMDILRSFIMDICMAPKLTQDLGRLAKSSRTSQMFNQWYVCNRGPGIFCLLAC